MSSEHLASAQNQLKGDLAGSWNILDGASGQYTDLGIARRFGGAAAAYSLRDIGAMNGPVVQVRRSSDSTDAIDDEQKFSANQIASGALEDWVNGKLETTLPADVSTASAAYSLRKVKADYGGPAVRVRRSSDSLEADVNFDSDDKISNNSIIASDTSGSFSVTGNSNPSYNRTYVYNDSNGRWESQGAESSQYYFLDNGTWTLIYAGSNPAASLVSAQYPWTSTWGGFLSGSTFNTSNVIFSSSSQTLGSFLTETAPNFSGNALNFDGSSTYVNISQITLSGDFTFSFDAFVDFNNGGGGRVAGRTTAAGWVANIADSTSLSFRANGSGGKAITFDSAISSGEHSFVLTRSSNTVSLSIDGVTQADTKTEENNFTINFIGRQASNYFKGSLRNINFGSASYNGYGNTDADWEDQTGSNDGTVTGTADTFIGDAAFVHTWYDQTDNNDAIQDNNPNQPKIVENGALFDYINFDGNTFMDIGAFLMNATDGHFFMVTSNVDTDIETFHLSNRSGAKGLNFRNDTSNKGKLQVTFVGSASITSSDVIIANESDNKQLIAFSKDSNDVEFFNNGAIVADDGTSISYTTATGTANTSIGKQGNSSSASTDVKQRIYELITYDTDETDNRFKIESNINNYYSLYNVNGDGFVQTWYDQSGNGNNATQSTAADQPKIVENGSLVTSESGETTIKFIGSSLSSGSYGGGNFLAANSLASTFSGDNKTISSFLVSSSVENNTNGVMFGFGRSSDDTPKLLGLYHSGGKIGVQFRADDNTSQTHQTTITYSANTDLLYTIIRPSTTADLIKDGTIGQDDIDVDVGDTTLDRFSIGVLTRTSNALFLNGTVSELIIYSTDQGSDRTEIETDINNYYNIYS